MIVMKFGGSSLESAAAIERVARIIQGRQVLRPVVVVSAMGKTTDNLLAAAAAAASGQRDRSLDRIYELHEFHLREAQAVAAESEHADLIRVINQHFQELMDLLNGLAILGEVTPRANDAVASYGERLSSLIVTAALGKLGLEATHLDSREVIVTDSRHMQAAPNFPESYRRLADKLAPLAAHKIIVMGGFIGGTLDGVTTTLGRGGSDFTASIVGAGITAESIEIWTDVDGLLTADPAIFPGAHRVKAISFTEAAELAYFGAKVLHPSTLIPAIEHNIAVFILNSRRPEVAGTRITAAAVAGSNVVKAIASKRHITLVNIRSTRMLMAHGFLRRIFEVFDHYETPVDMISTSEVSVSLTLDNTAHLEAIVERLRAFSEVDVERENAILCVVGENLRFVPGIARRVFEALAGINIRMISQGASLVNLSLVVADSDLRRAVKVLHEALFAELDPAVFERNEALHV
jgi:aspartate kinase